MSKIVDRIKILYFNFEIFLIYIEKLLILQYNDIEGNIISTNEGGII